jgi:hypothetical protein
MGQALGVVAMARQRLLQSADGTSAAQRQRAVPCDARARRKAAASAHARVRGRETGEDPSDGARIAAVAYRAQQPQRIATVDRQRRHRCVQAGVAYEPASNRGAGTPRRVRRRRRAIRIATAGTVAPPA